MLLSDDLQMEIILVHSKLDPSVTTNFFKVEERKKERRVRE